VLLVPPIPVPLILVQPVLAASGAGSNALFYTLLVLHVAAALTGFGSIGFAGSYAGRAAQLFVPDGRADLAPPSPSLGVGAGPLAAAPYPDAPPAMTNEELVRYFRRPAGLWWALLAVPWLGLGTLAADPHGGGVGQAWTLAAFVLWVGAALVAAAVVGPALRRVRATLVPATAGPGPVALGATARAGAARSGRRASRGAAVCDVLFVLALALMIWQP
jgi:hypothetical protein